MTARGAALVAAAASLAFIAAGGGGRDPVAALAWQAAAIATLAIAGGLALSRDGRPLRLALGALVVVLLVSAWDADRRHASISQAIAWSLALAPALALAAASSRRDRGSPREGVAGASAALLWASVGLLAVQVVALAGWPLLGTAGGRPDPGAGRVVGTFMDPNHLACALALVAAVNAPLAGLVRGSRGHLAVAAIAGVGALATRSRVAVLCIAALVVAEAWRRRAPLAAPQAARRWRAIVAVGLLLAAAAGALTSWIRRGEADAWARPAIWAGAAPAVLERPLLGLGPAGFQSEWPRFQRPLARGLSRFGKVATTPHGEWLRVPIETGLLGVASLAAVALLLRRRAGTHARDLLPVTAAAGPALLVHDAFHAPAFVAWLAAGLAFAATRDARGPDLPPLLPPGSRREAAAWLVLGLLLAIIVRQHVAERALEEHVRSGAAAALATARALSPGDIDALLADARRARDGSLGGALASAALLEDAARMAPQDAETALERARGLAALQRGAGTSLRPVAAAYAMAADLAPSDAWRRAEAAAILVTGGDPAGGLGAADEALALEPALARAHAWRIVALQHLGRTDEARVARERLGELLRVAGAASASGYERDLVALDEGLARAVGLAP